MDSTPPHSTFTFFPRLPKELQLKIWKEVADLPRCIDLWPKRTFESIHDNGKNYHFRWITHTLPPAMLHTCQVSRSIGLQYYELGFGTESYVGRSDQEIKVTSPARIFVNWECDIICPVSKMELLSTNLVSNEWDDYDEYEDYWNVFFRDEKLQHIALETRTLEWYTRYTFPEAYFTDSIKRLLLYVSKIEPQANASSYNGIFDFSRLDAESPPRHSEMLKHYREELLQDWVSLNEKLPKKISINHKFDLPEVNLVYPKIRGERQEILDWP